MEALANRIVAEGLSVRSTEELVSVGDHDKKRKTRQRKSRITAPGLQDLADRIGERLDTRVRIDMRRNKGTISIEFATTGDLQRIVGLIDRD